jgi:hypothetical protein
MPNKQIFNILILKTDQKNYKAFANHQEEFDDDETVLSGYAYGKGPSNLGGDSSFQHTDP